jgi:hypothetical protein
MGWFSEVGDFHGIGPLVDLDQSIMVDHYAPL